MQSEQKNPDAVEQSREQVLELGSDLTKGKNGNIYTLTVIGQIEGHQTLPETAKTTKYEHVLPLLAGIEESDEIDGLFLVFCSAINGHLLSVLLQKAGSLQSPDRSHILLTAPHVFRYLQWNRC